MGSTPLLYSRIFSIVIWRAFTTETIVCKATSDNPIWESGSVFQHNRTYLGWLVPPPEISAIAIGDLSTLGSAPGASARSLALASHDGQSDQSRDHYGDVGDADELFEHHQHPRRRSDRQDIADTDCRKIGKAQKEKFDESPRLSGAGVADETLRVPRLADQVKVGETPSDQCEGCAGGEQLVAGDSFILHHVRNQTTGRVEVKRRLQER